MVVYLIFLDIQESYVDYDEKQMLSGHDQEINCLPSRVLPIAAEMMVRQTPLVMESTDELAANAGSHLQEAGATTGPPDILSQGTPSSFRTADIECPASPQLRDSEEFFARTIASYLKQLSRTHNIKAKVEMMQILEKYIEMEETATRH